MTICMYDCLGMMLEDHFVVKNEDLSYNDIHEMLNSVKGGPVKRYGIMNFNGTASIYLYARFTLARSEAVYHNENGFFLYHFEFEFQT